ncbi:TxMEKL-P2 [Frankliniella fusca]|uniref:TxMEKL-P2 n=1 Tax=Frankliniella fusca TaxID=407009 RepID=A0AAE1GP56_9NEOP|nr:TxMEKL-P2 [Frankliniella fusca]
MDAKLGLVFLFLVAALVVSPTRGQQGGGDSKQRCADNNRSCYSSAECCSGCCSLGTCNPLDRCAAQTQGACAVHYCPPDKECYLQVVQCVTAPCPPLPACRPKNSNDYDNYD